MILQNVSQDGKFANLSFTLPRGDLEKALKILKKEKTNIGYKKINASNSISKISVVGVGMRSHAGVAQTLFDTLGKNKINIQKLSEKGVKIFFTQVFQHNFFHADMHPGNIFVSTENPDDPTYCAVDFGIMGSLSEEDQRYLALNFLAFFERDYRRVAQLHIDSKWVGEGTRLEEFEAAIRSVCEPIFEKPLKEISFGNLLLRLFSVARQFNMEVQPQLVLLQKTLLNIEGLGRDLYPDLDLWATAKPFFEKWAKDNMSLKATIKKLVKEAPIIYNDLSNIPKLIKQIGDYENQNKMIEKNIILNSENNSKKAQINLLLLINIILILFIALYVI